MNRSKRCFKCGVEKPIGEFYKHPMMADGHLNKCKACARADVRSNRAARIVYYRDYDRQRGNRQSKAYRAKCRKRSPKAAWARCCVGNAIRDGKLKRGTACEMCGAHMYLHAHHDDYDRPLDVRWLCAACHNAWHHAHGPGLHRDSDR